jgi:hypothetical protein
MKHGILVAQQGKYRDNLAIDTSAPYAGGTDEGNKK